MTTMAKPTVKAKRAAPAKRAVRKSASAPAAESEDAVADIAAAITSLTDAISADRLDQFPPELMQRLMAATVRAYSAKVQAGESFLPFDDRAARVSPTDIMITASALLKAGDLQVFELGMWQSYTGR
jgi:hypothetical protein